MSKSQSIKEKQLWLIQLKNPLISRLGKDFFSSIPKCPGVYRMLNERSELVYVGKAKNLRDRIRSYTHVHSGNASRKTLRLVHAIRSIEWEVHEDEKSALLRENYLLRTLKPIFNIANTSPHTYQFVHLRLEKEGIRLHVAMQSDVNYKDIYGAFKNMGLVYRTQKALLRLFWMSFNECRHGFELPSVLTNRRKLDHYLFSLPEEMDQKTRDVVYRDLKRFFNGTSQALIQKMVVKLLEIEGLPIFTRGYIQADIETALEFYERCAKRNRKIKKEFKLEEPLLAQDQIDDYLVLLRHGNDK